VISSVRNPKTVRDTKSFQIFISDSAGQVLAGITSSLIFKAEPGTVQGLTTASVISSVSSQNEITVTF
jgi:hypothetical protein